MKKATLLAPRNAAREILSEADAQRMLDSGSWVIATIPKKPTAGARNQRAYMQRRLAAGFKKLETLLPERVYDALAAMRREGESTAELIARLIESSDDNDETRQVRRQK